jgi:hypothetical protein
MKKQAVAQRNALNRVLYLLEEGSFQSLAEDSKDFAQVIEEIYVRAARASDALV